MDVIPFSTERIDHYPVDYNPQTHAVDFPVIPGDVIAAVCILDRIISDIVGMGVLEPEDVYMVLLNATGRLKPEVLKN